MIAPDHSPLDERFVESTESLQTALRHLGEAIRRDTTGQFNKLLNELSNTKR